MSNNKLQHPEVVDSETLLLLHDIQENPVFNQFYLAGGTSLALQIGHRISDDLDFFTAKEFKSNIVQAIPLQYEVNSLYDNNVELFINGVKVMFMFFAYPLHEKLKTYENNLNLSAPLDIGLMKLLAISGRTTRKDIIDLYFIDKEIFALDKLLPLFEEFYPEDSKNSYDSVRRLLNREVLEAQPMPKMLKGCKWEECYDYVSEKILNYYRKALSDT